MAVPVPRRRQIVGEANGSVSGRSVNCTRQALHYVWMLRFCAPSLSHDAFEKAETGENRRQGLLLKPAKRGAAHNLRINTYVQGSISDADTHRSRPKPCTHDASLLREGFRRSLPLYRSP